MSWVTTFTLSSPQGISDFDLADSKTLKHSVAAIMQDCPNQLKIGLCLEGDAEAAVSQGLEAVWTALEEVGIEAEIESAFLGTDIDCTPQVRELEWVRRSLLNQTPNRQGDQATGLSGH